MQSFNKTSTIIYGMIPLLISGCVSASKHKDLQKQLEQTRDKNHRIEARNVNLRGQMVEIEADYAKLKKKLEADIEKQKLKYERDIVEQKKEEQTLQEMVYALREEKETNLVRIKKMKNALKVELVGKLFFAAGSAKLTRQARKTISRIAPILKEADGKIIKIIGHADNLPPNSKLKNRYPSNWELSTARAASIIRILQWGYEISPQRMRAIGVAHYQPLSAEEGYSPMEANRVADILLVPSN